MVILLSSAAYDVHVIGFQAIDLELCYFATNWVHVHTFYQ